ncbi:MAG: hypothetical protein NC094_08690 [Bacteroidales bacterium]|nr:hypothetical protein [Lachnoclostridium sp.]MCM1385543.1 hypothetical protein [Lachnoclostridium sp.]MCM1465481.1 hypothetical protein [Bacteroidales bacterium]
MNFIEWCNNNMGFASLLLSALTLFVSILAIIVSIHTAKLPYKKKLLVTSGSYFTDGSIGIHITASNVENRNIKIKTIGILMGKMVYVNKNSLFDSQVILTQGDVTSQYFDLEDLKVSIAMNKIKSSTRMIAMIEDTEGKRYKKRLPKIKKII